MSGFFTWFTIIDLKFAYENGNIIDKLLLDDQYI